MQCAGRALQASIAERSCFVQTLGTYVGTMAIIFDNGFGQKNGQVDLPSCYNYGFKSSTGGEVLKMAVDFTHRLQLIAQKIDGAGFPPVPLLFVPVHEARLGIHIRQHGPERGQLQTQQGRRGRFGREGRVMTGHTLQGGMRFIF